MDAQVVSLLRRHPMFGCLPADSWGAICGGAAMVELEPGNTLYRQGEPADALFLVVGGSLTLQDSWCPDDAIFPIGTGELVGAGALVPGSLRAHTALAMDHARAWPIPAAGLARHLDQDFGKALAMIASLSARLRARVKEIAEFKLQSTSERLAGYLADLAEVEEGPAILRLTCEKRMLAEQLGMDPATLSRAFAKLRGLGVTSDRKDRVSVADVARLRDYAMPDGGLHMGGFG